MSLRFAQQKIHSNAAMNSSTNVIVIPCTDISMYESFSVLYQNSMSNIAFLDMIVQGAYDPSGTAAGQAPNWFNIPTGTLAAPSALAATATVWTTAVSPNTLHWLRVLAKTDSTATAIGSFAITVAGFTRA